MSRKSGKGRRVSLGVVLGQMLPVALCSGCSAAVGILHVASRSQVVDAGYRLSALEAESRTLALANDRLKLELATLKRPARLEAIARGQLGHGAAGRLGASLGRSPAPRAAGRPCRRGPAARWPIAAPRDDRPPAPPSVDVHRRS